MPDKRQVSDIRLIAISRECYRFPPPHSIHRRSVNSGSIALAFAGGALSDTEHRPAIRWIPDFRPGVMEATQHIGRATSHGRLGSFRLPFGDASGRSSGKAGLAFRSATPRDREVMTGEGAFLSPPCARGGRGDKNPLHPRQADLLSEPGGKPGAEAVGHDRLQACSDRRCWHPCSAAGQSRHRSALSMGGANALLGPSPGLVMFSIKRVAKI